VIGEAVLAGMREVRCLRGSTSAGAAAAALWAKLYSRFLRSLVPSMIIADSVDVPPNGTLDATDPGQSDQSMSMSAEHANIESAT
jgi:hypothetical protein